MFSKRLIKPELLDHLPPEEARPNLADLVRINKNFGGHSVLRKTLARVAGPTERFTLLDVGAASGDTARLIQELFPRASIFSLDHNAVNLGNAPHPKLLADAFRLPFKPGSFDFVLSSLFLHHFEDARVVELLRNFYETARRGLLICDLERHVVPYFFLPASKVLFRWQPITIHDGVISVRASFRANELLHLSREAGIEAPEVRVHRPAFRLSLVALKNGAAEIPLGQRTGGYSEEDTHRGRTSRNAGCANSLVRPPDGAQNAMPNSSVVPA
ncbi:MAG TPA: methyltransferase domain-containing protein [Bryobacteraceae bacterium]|nr:methyltransferase domain-containing protein [Bryobacteraceae bacterium]